MGWERTVADVVNAPKRRSFTLSGQRPSRPEMPSIRHALAAAAALSLILVAGCGGGSSAQNEAPPPAGAQLLQDRTLSGYPQAFDVYAPASPSRVVVFLHGGLGNKERFAYNMGITSSADAATTGTVNWSWLAARGVVAVVPQGQALPNAPLATTWNNHVMDSGVNDVAFLQALVTRLRADYGNLPVSVVGHSNGGMMVNRMWCESPQTFDVHVAFAGPASSYYLDAATPCAPSTFKPYLGYVGDSDQILGGSQNWTQQVWELDRFNNAQAFVNPEVIGEWAQFVERAGRVCGATPALDGGTTSGIITTWQACSGRLRVQRATGLDHDLGAPSASDPTVLSDRALDFIIARETR
ncbi:MAG: hypothetical protein H6933_14820 [Burkholderiaceae bacterium]|nr:hypothetical protein [Burkholderiaceae bacterium]